MKKILIVDDEPSISDLLQALLLREKYLVDTAADGATALEKVREFQPDLILLDLMLPDMSGHDVCRRVSETGHIPIIMLTARNEVIDKVLGLELGADDYITKPFDNRELLARVKVVLRRFEAPDVVPSQDAVQFGPLSINFSDKMVERQGKTLALTPKEYQLLEVLARNPRRVFSREELIDKAWGYDYLGDSRAVDIAITRLRKKVEVDPSQPRLIQTVFGFGYRFGGT